MNIFVRTSSLDQNEPESDNDSSVIDTSWIDDFSRLQHIYNNQQRELMNTISASFIYINKNNYIEKIVSEVLDLETKDLTKFSFLSKENLLKIIQNKKLSTSFSKYTCSELMSFVVDLEPEFIQDFFKDERFFDERATTFLKVLPIFNDVHIEKTIFIFRNINHLYFLFNESGSNRHTLRSILKKNDGVDAPVHRHSHTKKVRMVVSNTK